VARLSASVTLLLGAVFGVVTLLVAIDAISRRTVPALVSRLAARLAAAIFGAVLLGVPNLEAVFAFALRVGCRTVISDVPFSIALVTSERGPTFDKKGPELYPRIMDSRIWLT
jgi:hypothetical protein